MNLDDHRVRLGRRAFLQSGTLVLSAGTLGVCGLSAASLLSAEANEPRPLRVGLVTDMHYADKPSAGTRHYRETLAKLDEAGRQFVRDEVSLVVELGDFIDAADSVDVERGYLKTIQSKFATLSNDRHHVLGNHCVDTLTKEEFLGEVGQPKSYYSFDRGGVHFIVLDACFRADGESYGRKNFVWTDANIPAAELEWLKADLKATKNPVVVFVHQRLDVANSYGVRNNADVRAALESHGKVLAVFQGHSHKNDLNEIGGIHYCTLVAMVEGAGADNNGYSVLEIAPDQTLRLTGFRQQMSRRW